VQAAADGVPNIRLDEWVVAAGVSGGVSYGATQHGLAGVFAGVLTLGVGVVIELMKRESAKRAVRRNAAS